MGLIQKSHVALIYTSIAASALLVSGCGSSSDSATEEYNSVAAKSVILDGDSRCPNGGVEIFTGIDTNGNGILDESEQQDSEVVCNGIDGYSALTNSTPIAAGDVNSSCPNGGVEVSTGLDTNRNGVLDTDEITSTESVCNGLDGLDGENGYSTLISNGPVAVGDTECANGGVELNIGLDMNRNGVLDVSEITSTRKICNGIDGVNAQTAPVIHTLFASPTTVAAGGVVNLGAVVTDPDNGVLTYNWTDANGVSIATSKMTSVVAPSVAGSYLYGFTAMDDMNNTVTGYINIDVMDTNATQTAQTQDVVIGDTNSSITIVLPPEVEVHAVTGDIDGTVLVSGPDQEVAGTIFTKPAFNGEQTAQEFLTNTINTLATSLAPSGATLSNISTRNISSNPVFTSGVTAYYDVNLTEDKNSVDFINEIVNLIASNIQGGSITTSLAPSTSAVATNLYTMGVTVQYQDQDNVVVRLAFSDDTNYPTYESVVNNIIDPGTTVVAGMITETTTDTFTARAVNSVNYADFLFVVDNSGSMGSYQDAVQAAASSFANSLSTNSLNYNIGIITTDNPTLVGGDFIDNNITEFENRIVVGSSGSATETGIYEAEQALQSIAEGDAVDGNVTASGYPRPGATLSVIILSDEPSQYTSRASGTFDPTNNLFVDRGYTVYGIVNTSDDGQYIDLADATGGAYTSIGDTSTFDQFMDVIAQQAGASANGYQLSHDFVNSASILVRVNGSEVAEDAVNGWTFYAPTSTILFNGTAVPNEGDTISVSYEYSRFAAITNMTLSLDAGSLIYIGDIVDINVLATYENNTSAETPLSDLNVTSSNTSVIDVSNGVVRAIGAGSADITVETNGVSSTIPVTVEGYRPLPLNQVTTGTPVAQGGEVLYAIDLNTTGTLEVTSISNTDTYGYILDENMSTITSNDDGGVNTNFLINTTLDAGTYYLRVTGYGGQEVSTYDINATFQ